MTDKFCGYSIAIGDRVYDLLQGYGDVISLEGTQISVRFKNGVIIHYTSEGNLQGKQRLYWHNPIIAVPPKKTTDWTTICDSIKPVLDWVSSLMKD